MPSLKNKWSDDDRRRFADGDRLRARAIPGKSKPGPSQHEWEDDDIINEDED